MVGCMEKGGIETMRVMGVSSLGFLLQRFTCNSNSLQVGSLGVAVFQTGVSGKGNHMGSNPPFRPPRHTT